MAQVADDIDEEVKAALIAGIVEINAVPDDWNKELASFDGSIATVKVGEKTHTYEILTEDEMDERLNDHITETLASFAPAFLSRFLPCDADTITGALADASHSSDMSALLKSFIVEQNRWSDLIQACKDEDGAGHFLNSYDGSLTEMGDYVVMRTD